MLATRSQADPGRMTILSAAQTGGRREWFHPLRKRELCGLASPGVAQLLSAEFAGAYRISK